MVISMEESNFKYKYECYKDLVITIKMCCGYMSSSDLKRMIIEDMKKIEKGTYELWED